MAEEDDPSQFTESIPALDEREFLELDRDLHRMNAQHQFTMASIYILGTMGFGTITALARAPFGLLIAIPTALCIYAAIRHFGQGIQEAADSVAPNIVLHQCSDRATAEQPRHDMQEVTSTEGMVHDHTQTIRFH
jgi:hypothetical protein